MEGVEGSEGGGHSAQLRAKNLPLPGIASQASALDLKTVCKQCGAKSPGWEQLGQLPSEPSMGCCIPYSNSAHLSGAGGEDHVHLQGVSQHKGTRPVSPLCYWCCDILLDADQGPRAPRDHSGKNQEVSLGRRGVLELVDI